MSRAVVWLALFALLLCAGAPCAAHTPQTLFLNIPPGISWNQNDPNSVTRALFDEITGAVGKSGNGSIRVGVSFIFSTLDGTATNLAATLARVLSLSEETETPVLITLDGENWWDGRPDLWNWWDPSQPGYDPTNAENVEWFGWTSRDAVKIGWRNWGRQIRVLPAPNLASPRFLRANTDALRPLAAILARWVRGLPSDKKGLFGGVKLGWEAGTGYNAFFYPDGNRYLEQWPADPSHDPQSGLDLTRGLSGGVAQIGYAAVNTAGIKRSGNITRADLAEVTRRYLELLARTAAEAGVPTDRIFVHQGGTYAPWGTHIPFTAAFNRWSTPGWSFYGVDPATAADLRADMDRAHRQQWVAAEWWWGGATVDEWVDHIRRTLQYRDCRFICVYNWGSAGMRPGEPGVEAIRRLLQ